MGRWGMDECEEQLVQGLEEGWRWWVLFGVGVRGGVVF